MQSINLLLKVLWSPGEVMFLLSKNPRIAVPIIFLCLFSLLTGAVVLTKVDSAELAMRTIERSATGGQLSVDRDSVSPLVFAGVNTIDLVSIWILILLVIGYGFVTRKSLSKTTRAGAIVGVFLGYVALRLAFAALRGV